MIEPTWQRDGFRLYLGDCLEILPQFQPGEFDCCVTDPPYGIREAAGKNASRTHLAEARDYGNQPWDDAPPPPKFFDYMRRVSREQVVFGGNHLATWLGSSPSWIVWDKDNGENDFADCELAWTSHKRAVRKIVHRWAGMLTEPGHPKDDRVHPTQKPERVMRWIIQNYTKDGDMIIDPYLGSGTTGVACARLGRKFTGIEISEKYFNIAVKRIEAELRQGKLFA